MAQLFIHMTKVVDLALDRGCKDCGSQTDLDDLWLSRLYALFRHDGYNGRNEPQQIRTLFPRELITSLARCRDANLLTGRLEFLTRLLAVPQWRMRAVSAARPIKLPGTRTMLEIRQAQDKLLLAIPPGASSSYLNCPPYPLPIPFSSLSISPVSMNATLDAASLECGVSASLTAPIPCTTDLRQTMPQPSAAMAHPSSSCLSERAATPCMPAIVQTRGRSPTCSERLKNLV